MNFCPTCVSAGNSRSQSGRFSALFRRLLGRLYLLAAIIALEAILTAGALHVGLNFPSHLFKFATVFFAVFLCLGHSWLKAQREDIPFGWVFLGGYLACIAAGICIHFMAAPQPVGVPFSYAPSDFAIDAAILLKIPLLALACVPLRLWIRVVRATNPLWLYSFIAGEAALFLMGPSRFLWNKAFLVPGSIMQIVTLHSVYSVLIRVMPDTTVDPSAFAIGTPRFSVIIGPGCSGMEGLGLIFAFTSVWLWYFRKECRFPRALLLIPGALACIWLLNIVRLSALVLIGDKISPEIAMVGFHSHFGWITFTAVALVFSMAAQKLSWVRKAPSMASSSDEGQTPKVGMEAAAGALREGSGQDGESPAIRAYLLPFLAILAATFVSKAASGYFEWLYPLRFVVAVAVLWHFWPELKKLNWRFGWFGPAIGAAVFLVWIAPSWIAQTWWAHQPAASPLGAALEALSPAARWSWIAFRVAAAVVTVPLAEELAFRGYLARRFVSREFENVSFTALTGLPVLLSSVVFGLMHMKDLTDWQHLLLGTLAGLAFAAALRWRGRMGDAVAAHAVCNLMLAAWVLGMGDWAQW